MKKATERKIIFTAVKKAFKKEDMDKNEKIRLSAILADKKGVNVQTASYLQDIFYEALNEIN